MSCPNIMSVSSSDIPIFLNAAAPMFWASVTVTRTVPGGVGSRKFDVVTEEVIKVYPFSVIA